MGNVSWNNSFLELLGVEVILTEGSEGTDGSIVIIIGE